MPGLYAGLNRLFYDYTSDNGGTAYQVATTADNASAGSFAVIPYGTLPTYPRGWKMRHAYGVAGDLTRTKIPLDNPGNSIYIGGSTSFTKGGKSFIVEGIIGEKRTAKS